MNPCRYAILLLCCVLAGYVRAGEFASRTWENDDGLPSSSVLAIAQTRDGYLWLGTLNGLVRFDGLHFTTFDSVNTPALRDSRVVFLFADSSDRLWIGTLSGISLLHDAMFTVPAGLPTGGSDRRLVSACEDTNGAVWLLCANKELWRYDGEQFTPFVVQPGEGSAGRSIIKERDGPAWIATDVSQTAIGVTGTTTLQLPAQEEIPGSVDALVASRKNGYWRLANYRVEFWIRNRRQRDYGPYPWPPGGTLSTCEDSEGNLIVGTQGAGLYRIARADGKVTVVSTNSGLSHTFVLAAFTDREGTLWVGTDGGGLNRLKPQAFSVVEQTRGWVVQSVAEDREGRIWIASNGEGVGRFADGNLQRYGLLEGVPRFTKSIFIDNAQHVWIGTTDSGLLQFHDGRFFSSAVPQVQAMYEDRQGNTWFGTEYGLYRLREKSQTLFSRGNGLSSEAVTAIGENSKGVIWIGTRRGGINRLEGDRAQAVPGPDDKTPEDIAALVVDTNDVLWATTFANGLLRYDRGKWTRFTKREGLVSNSLGYLLDTPEYLWIGSNLGVLRVSKRDLNELSESTRAFVQCRAFGKADGLPTAECTVGSQPAVMRDHNGKLWFPTIKGVAVLDPSQLRPNTNPPLVAIESVLVDNDQISGASSVILKPRNERLEIRYTSLNLRAPERALFRYRLEGHETHWIDAGDRRVAPYSKLPPGQYTFHVTACNEDGVWNETGRQLAVIVQPPYWRTWWFITAMTLATIGVIAGTVYLVSRQRYERQLGVLRQQEALEKERARIARDIHDQVGASLTQVTLLGELVESDKDSPPDVESHAQQICQTARETTRALDEIVWTVNPSNDTLEGLVNYICKYAQDYLGVAGVKYRLDLPSEVPEVAIAPDVRHNVFLASKEAITNIVRHAQASSAWLRIKVAGSSFTVEIEDNGRGLGGLDPQAARTRHGLSNMRKRMEDIGGEFVLEPGAENGARVRLTVPLKSIRGIHPV